MTFSGDKEGLSKKVLHKDKSLHKCFTKVLVKPLTSSPLHNQKEVNKMEEILKRLNNRYATRSEIISLTEECLTKIKDLISDNKKLEEHIKFLQKEIKNKNKEIVDIENKLKEQDGKIRVINIGD